MLTGPQFALLFLAILLASSSVPLAEVYFWHPVFERTAIEQAEVINAWPCSDPGEVYLILIADTVPFPVNSALGVRLGIGLGKQSFCESKSVLNFGFGSESDSPPGTRRAPALNCTTSPYARLYTAYLVHTPDDSSLAYSVRPRSDD